jgi:hypothetical protein
VPRSECHSFSAFRRRKTQEFPANFSNAVALNCCKRRSNGTRTGEIEETHSVITIAEIVHRVDQTETWAFRGFLAGVRPELPGCGSPTSEVPHSKAPIGGVVFRVSHHWDAFVESAPLPKPIMDTVVALEVWRAMRRLALTSPVAARTLDGSQAISSPENAVEEGLRLVLCVAGG